MENPIEELDTIPTAMQIEIEDKCRKRRVILFRKAERAVALEGRINEVIKQLRINLAPPAKFFRPKPLTRLYLPPKKKIIEKKKVPISDINKLFYKAFTDTAPSEVIYDRPEDLEIIQSLKHNCIPFYFDYFLQLRDYVPVYDFKTKIELTEGREEDLFIYKDVLENVYEGLKKWEKYKKSEMDKHIRQTWFLYVDDDSPAMKNED